MARDDDLTARIEPFDSFWEAPPDIEKGYRTFGEFYRHNYLEYLPEDRNARILVISCGPGYFVRLMGEEGFRRVTGIDSDPEKVAYAERHGLDCRVARAFDFLERAGEPYDVIFAEQEINHLTKPEILEFLDACRRALRPGGSLLLHSINGASPLTGAEARAGNFDHYNSFTEYSLKQVLEHRGFGGVRVFPLNLYVFYKNPLNYVALGVWTLLSLAFRAGFLLVGKDARIFTKKIGAVGRVEAERPAEGPLESLEGSVE